MYLFAVYQSLIVTSLILVLYSPILTCYILVYMCVCWMYKTTSTATFSITTDMLYHPRCFCFTATENCMRFSKFNHEGSFCDPKLIMLENQETRCIYMQDNIGDNIFYYYDNLLIHMLLPVKVNYLIKHLYTLSFKINIERCIFVMKSPKLSEVT